MAAASHIIIQGHRGARGLYPENTIGAFIGATQLGVDVLELDVVISKDEQVVVSHEAWMNAAFCTRPDGVAVEHDPLKYNLYHMPYAEIARYDCGLRGNAQFPHQQKMAAYKPLLRQVFEKIEAYTTQHQLRPMHYNIELKSEQPAGVFEPRATIFVDLVYEQVQAFGLHGRVNLQSFDKQLLRQVKIIDDTIQIALLTEDEHSLDHHLNELGFVPHIYSPDYTMMYEGLVDAVHNSGMQLIPWTVNETGDMKLLADLGVDGIITDYPDRAIHLLRNKL